MKGAGVSALRVIIAAILLSPVVGQETTVRTTLFVAASLYIALALALTIVIRKFVEVRQGKYAILALDFVFILKMATTISSLESYLLYAYFFLILLASLELGTKGSVPMALSLSAFDYYYTGLTGDGLYLYGSIVTRIGFAWIVALALGTTFQNLAEDKDKIEQLNENLDRKITVLVSASRVLGSMNDLEKLVLYFQETIGRIFGIDKHVLVIRPDSKAEPLVVSSAMVDRDLLRGDLFQIKEEMLITDSRLKDLGVSVGATHKGTQGFYLLLVGGGGLQKILTDKDIFQTIFTQFILAIDNALLVQQAKEASLTDHLTTLYNQRYFYVRFAEELNRVHRTRGDLSLLIIDVDDFKAYNDSYGHLSGDKALAKIAALIRSSCRESDVAARYGGEEFVVILPDTDSKSATAVAQRIINEVSDARYPGHSADLETELTVSIGVSSFPNNGSDATEIIECADKALYRAKALGKNRYVLARKRHQSKKEQSADETRSA